MKEDVIAMSRNLAADVTSRPSERPGIVKYPLPDETSHV